MLIQDTAINFRWELKASASYANHVEAYFDLQITAPDGTVTYLEGSSSWSDLFTQPTASTNGLIEYSYTPTQNGVYTMILGTGDSDSFTILNTRIVLIVEADTVDTEIVSFN